MYGHYDIGDMVRLFGNYYVLSDPTDPNSTRVPTDPDVCTVKVEKPDGSTASYTDAVHDSTGHYHKDIEIDQAGEWWYRFEGTGAVKAAEERVFRVRVRQVG